MPWRARERRIIWLLARRLVLETNASATRYLFAPVSGRDVFRTFIRLYSAFDGDDGALVTLNDRHITPFSTGFFSASESDSFSPEKSKVSNKQFDVFQMDPLGYCVRLSVAHTRTKALLNTMESNYSILNLFHFHYCRHYIFFCFVRQLSFVRPPGSSPDFLSSRSVRISAGPLRDIFSGKRVVIYI